MKFKGYRSILLIIFSLFALYLTSRYNYLLFHSLVEIFSVVVAFGIFIIAWNSRSLLDNHYLLFIGVAYLFVGAIDLIHTLAYKGMGVFKGQETNLATQLWIGARYLESLSLLIAPCFIKRRVRASLEFLGYMIIISLLFMSIFYWKFFPVCFTEGLGLTPFKKISEYVISLILFGSLIILYEKRGVFDTSVFRLLALSIVFTIASELSFTFYVHAYGFSNLIGHLFKVISFYLIYQALVETGLTKPYNLLFRNLKKSEGELRKAHDELEIRVQERTAELAKVNRALRTLSECNQVIVRAKEEPGLLQEMCRTIVEVGGYHLAWIGFVEKYKEKAIQPVAKAGFKEEYGNLTWLDNKEDNDPVGLAIQTRRSTMAKNILNEPAFRNLRKEAIKWGYTSSVALPLITDGQSIGVLSIYSKGPDAFDLEEMKLLEELSNDLTYGILALRTQTERKRAEETLRESEDRYRDLVENSWDFICTHDLKGQILSVNPGPAKLLGYEQSDLLKMNLRDLLVPEVRDQFDAYLSTIQRDGVAKGLMVVQTRTGERRTWEYRNTLRTEGVMTPIVRGMAHDITEREHAEEALRTEREKLELVTQNMGAGLAFISKDYRTLWANNVLKRIFGDVEGKPCYSTYNKRTEICPECGVREVFEKGSEKVIHEQVGKDIEGNTIWSEIIATPIKDKDGNITAGLELVIPITERKQAEEALRSSEEKYRTILENIEDGYFEVDTAGNFTFFNDSMWRIYGYPREEMMGMNNRQYTDQENAKKLFQAFNKVYRTGESTKEFDWEIIRKDGTKRNIESSVSLMKAPSGDRIGFRGIVRDVTDRKQFEQEKAALEEQLRQSQKMEAIGRLAGGVAHDFNNLLTVIKGYSQLSLAEMKEGDPFKGNIEEIKKAADRAADLTRQLLAFSRRQIMEMKVLDLNDLLRNLDKMLHRVIGEDIKLLFRLTEDLGRVKTDPGQIEQVVVNLVVNARDAMPSGGRLTIETGNVVLDEEYAGSHVAVKPGPYVMLSVSDTGVGMTREVRERVFEPFFTTKEKGKGTGLGLSTVYGIVKQSGGNIWVYSEPGRGTTFKIYLPRVDEPLEELKGEVEKEELPQGNETILIVEDDEDVRKLAERVLEKQGYAVLVASQGSEALSLCGEYKKRIHLVLCDVVMPGMGGRELTDHLTSFHPEMKVLYMSGYTENAIVHHGILIEGMNYIQKPFTVEGLARKVREALGK
jgi:PAS domain S-box-containing protein